MAFNTLVDGNTIEVSKLNENFSNSKHFLGELKQICLSISGAETKANMQAKGWAICDGTTPSTQGISDADITTTPDLQDKFIRMSNDETSGTTGGSDTVPNHKHQIPGGQPSGNYSAHFKNLYGSGSDDVTSFLAAVQTNTEGTRSTLLTSNQTSSVDNRPAFYELVFFIKVKIV